MLQIAYGGNLTCFENSILTSWATFCKLFFGDDGLAFRGGMHAKPETLHVSATVWVHQGSEAPSQQVAVLLFQDKLCWSRGAPATSQRKLRMCSVLGPALCSWQRLTPQVLSGLDVLACTFLATSCLLSSQQPSTKIHLTAWQSECHFSDQLHLHFQLQAQVKPCKTWAFWYSSYWAKIKGFALIYLQR